MGGDAPRPAVACELCHEAVPQDASADHVDACLDRTLDEGDTFPVSGRGGGEAYHVRFVGYGAAGRHALHLEVRGGAEFHDLDEVLRRLWMECCGHLSLFEVGDTRIYRSEQSASQLGGRTMTTRFGKLVDDATELAYEYDFGSTTRVEADVVSARTRAGTRETVRVLATNEAPEPACGACGETAAQTVCSYCLYGSNPLLCEACASEHDCEDHALSPLANSPRAGVCGYTGPREGTLTHPDAGSGR
jgi:hypothetical protein